MRKLLEIFDQKLKNSPRDKVFGDLIIEINVQECSRKIKVSTSCVFDSLKLLKLLGIITVSNKKRTSISYKIGIYTTKHIDEEWIPYQYVREQLLRIPIKPVHFNTKFIRELEIYNILIKLFAKSLSVYFCNDHQDLNIRFSRVLEYIRIYINFLVKSQVQILDSYKKFRSMLLQTTSAKSIVSNKLYYRIIDLDFDKLTQTIENKDFAWIFTNSKNSLNFNLIKIIKRRNQEEIIKIILDLIKLKNLEGVILTRKKSRKANKINSYKRKKDHRAMILLSKSNKIKELQSFFSKDDSRRFNTLENMLVAKSHVFAQSTHQKFNCATFYDRDNLLPEYLCLAFDNIYELCANELNEQKLFSAIFAQHKWLRRGKAPSRYWLGTVEFEMSAYQMANAYHMITAFKNKTTKKIDGLEITEDDYSEFEKFKGLFTREFLRVFGYIPMNNGGMHMAFFNEYSMLKGLLTFQEARTAFEHETHSRMRMLYFIVAQMQYFYDTKKYRPINLEHLGTLDAKVEARIYTMEWEVGDKLSPTQIKQVDSYMTNFQNQAVSNDP